MGHEERFPPPRLSGRCRFGQGTSAGASGNDEDAPIPDLPVLSPERGGSDPKPTLITSRVCDRAGKEVDIRICP